jgi:membrane associated rhomboid family serine protease
MSHILLWKRTCTLELMLESDKLKLKDAILWISVFVTAFVGLFYLAEFEHWRLNSLGIQPRKWSEIWHVFTIHFIHGSQEHLWNNVAAFSILTGLLIFFYYDIAAKLFAYLWLGSPLILFFIGRDSYHIGASVLIYGLTAFLFFSGLFRKNGALKRVALTVVFIYGYTVWYMLPIEPGISWEGHLSGFVSGLFIAWIFRKEGPEDPVYQYELDPEIPDEYPFWLEGYENETEKNKGE